MIFVNLYSKLIYKDFDVLYNKEKNNGGNEWKLAKMQQICRII